MPQVSIHCEDEQLGAQRATRRVPEFDSVVILGLVASFLDAAGAPM